MNQFGEIVDNDMMRELQEEDFEHDDRFEDISCNRNGITHYGMNQILSQFSHDSLHDMLEKLGYDDGLYSKKSKVFTITFHTTSDLRVRIGDASKTDLNERAWDLMMDHYHSKFGATGAISNEHCVIFRMAHNKSYSVTYGCINKTNKEIEIIFTQDRSKNMLFTPSKGTVRSTVPPRSLIFVASSILEPGNNSYSYSYKFSSKLL